jgi:hypothetical protein
VRRARLRTRHDRPEAVARALTPDNTDQMETTVEAGTVVTTIERPTTGGLRTTADDYLTNLQVAAGLTDDTNNIDIDIDTDTNTDTNTDT